MKQVSVETEQVYGENWLKIIYGSPLVNSTLGCNQTCLVLEMVWQKNGLRKVEEKITPFISKYKLDEKEFLKDPTEYNSFNDFFSRKLIAQARPIDSSVTL